MWRQQQAEALPQRPRQIVEQACPDWFPRPRRAGGVGGRSGQRIDHLADARACPMQQYTLILLCYVEQQAGLLRALALQIAQNQHRTLAGRQSVNLGLHVLP